jgi:hypothetical protein
LAETLVECCRSFRTRMADDLQAYGGLGLGYDTEEMLSRAV